MSRRTILSRFTALALLAAPALALADSGQPCPKCPHPCASAGAVSAPVRAASPAPQSISSAEQQQIWTSP